MTEVISCLNKLLFCAYWVQLTMQWHRLFIMVIHHCECTNDEL